MNILNYSIFQIIGNKEHELIQQNVMMANGKVASSSIHQ